MKNIIILLLSVFVLASCEEGKTVKPDSVGAINSLSVIIENEMWEGAVGDTIREYFAAPVHGLPWDEPLFTINQMPPEVFTDFTRNSRNVLIAAKDTSETAGIKTNLFAKPQKVAILKAPTQDEIIEKVKNNANQIIDIFKEQEIAETQRRFHRSLNKEKDLEQDFGISLTMPSIYKVVKKDDNFIWIKRLIQKGEMNILVYEMPIESIPNDSTRTQAIIQMRDSIGERYVPGREEGMYMITEKAYAPYVFDAEIAGREAIETKGMWEVKNFFMAGPFINYVVEDEKNDRLLVIEGFTFAPSTEKRDYMFELEAVLKTLRFIDYTEEDKQVVAE